MTKSLVAFDTDRIKDYVFGTDKLKEIRGASALLDRLNREETPRLVGGDLVFANGGAGLVMTDSALARGIVQSVRRAYHQNTHSASITGVTVELSEDGEGRIADELELARLRMRATKDSPTRPTLPLAHPLLHFCDSCGIHGADTQDGDDMLCASCDCKRQEDRAVKENIRRWASKEQEPNRRHLWGRLVHELDARGYPLTSHRRPDDFQELGRLSSPSGYMALIYADGDGMGREIEGITTREEMQRFADVVDDSIFEVVAEAISTHLQPEERDSWPFDVLLLGGDDLVMVTRAQSAIRVALHLVEHFTKLTGRKWHRPLNLSASVVLAHVNYPIGALLNLAESGLKFAKNEGARRRREGQEFEGGLLNFLVVNSANHLDYGQYHKRTLKCEEGRRTFYRTQRPYTVGGMHDLLDKVQSVSGVPRTKLEQLRTAVFKSHRQGTVEAMKAVLRSRAAVRDKLLALVGGSPSEQLYLPWVQRDEENWVTPILDVVELVDFVEEGRAR